MSSLRSEKTLSGFGFSPALGAARLRRLRFLLQVRVPVAGQRRPPGVLGRVVVAHIAVVQPAVEGSE